MYEWHPRLDRVPGGSHDAYPAGAVHHNGKDADLRPFEQVGGEEVQRQDPLRLGPQELGQPGPSRRVAVSMPAVLRICQTVDGALVMPSPARPPGLDMHSHHRLRRAILVTIFFRSPTQSNISGAEMGYGSVMAKEDAMRAQWT